jgi:hypothetical protein
MGPSDTPVDHAKRDQCEGCDDRWKRKSGTVCLRVGPLHYVKRERDIAGCLLWRHNDGQRVPESENGRSTVGKIDEYSFPRRELNPRLGIGAIWAREPFLRNLSVGTFAIMGQQGSI